MKNLQNQLWATAVQLAQDSGMEYTVPCSHNVRDLIAAGARDMQREGRVSEDDMEKADASLSLLVKEMIRVTRNLGTRALSGNKTSIREVALVHAKELCPLWPFG
jgi:hypothetical protein